MRERVRVEELSPSAVREEELAERVEEELEPILELKVTEVVMLLRFDGEETEMIFTPGLVDLRVE